MTRIDWVPMVFGGILSRSTWKDNNEADVGPGVMRWNRIKKLKWDGQNNLKAADAGEKERKGKMR